MPAELRCLIFGYAIGQQHDDDVIHLDLVCHERILNHDRTLKHVRCFDHGNIERHKCWRILRPWENDVNGIANQEPGPLPLLLTCRLM